MSMRTSATRYAKALLDVTTSDADAAKVEQDLGTFVDLLHSNGELRQVLLSPSVPASAKRNIASAVAERIGRKSPITTSSGNSWRSIAR